VPIIRIDLFAGDKPGFIALDLRHARGGIDAEIVVVFDLLGVNLRLPVQATTEEMRGFIADLKKSHAKLAGEARLVSFDENWTFVVKAIGDHSGTIQFSGSARLRAFAQSAKRSEDADFAVHFDGLRTDQSYLIAFIRDLEAVMSQAVR
jgi:hypothetical protein